MAVGAGLQSLTILVIYLNSGFWVIDINPVLFVLPSLAGALAVAIFEEIIVRGIVFKFIEKRFGSYVALLLSALIFGALHMANPNSTAITALGLVILAELFFSSSLYLRPKLMVSYRIHFAWNFTETGIFGANVLENAVGNALLKTKFAGAHWLTGGEFGTEDSIQRRYFTWPPPLAYSY